MTATEVQTITATDGTVYGPDLRPVPQFEQPVDPNGEIVTVTPPPPVDVDRQARARELEQQLRHRVLDYSRNRPRSLQRRIGPSEVGTPCTRQLAYKVAQHPEVNADGGDPWPSYVGTAVHASLEETFAGSPEQWLTEQRIQVDDELAGSTDLVRLSGRVTVIDHKVVGTDKLRRYRREGPSEQYRVQCHLYAHGLIAAGTIVEDVAIAFWPRSGRLSDLHVWTEPYDQDTVDAALSKLALIRALHSQLGAQLFGALPIADAYCSSCPWFLPGAKDPSVACPGAGAR